MSLVSFGQPDDGIIQMAYVVTDIHRAMNLWISKLNVGPWFLLPSFTGDDPQYRGKPSRADVSLAMSFAGHMNVELIQPNNDAPSVYREVLEARGPGFHHWVSFKGQGTYFDPDLNINGKTAKVKGYTTDLLNDHANRVASLELVQRRVTVERPAHGLGKPGIEARTLG